MASSPITGSRRSRGSCCASSARHRAKSDMRYACSASRGAGSLSALARNSVLDTSAKARLRCVFTGALSTESTAYHAICVTLTTSAYAAACVASHTISGSGTRLLHRAHCASVRYARTRARSCACDVCGPSVSRADWNALPAAPSGAPPRPPPPAANSARIAALPDALPCASVVRHASVCAGSTTSASASVASTDSALSAYARTVAYCCASQATCIARTYISSACSFVLQYSRVFS